MKNPFKKTEKSSKQKKESFSIRKHDPLFIIFEKHLYDFNYESREIFIKKVVDEYLTYLAKQKISVPAIWRLHIEETLTEEISDVLVRKLYGCLTVQEFQAKETEKETFSATQNEIRKRYQKLVG